MLVICVWVCKLKLILLELYLILVLCFYVHAHWLSVLALPWGRHLCPLWHQKFAHSSMRSLWNVERVKSNKWTFIFKCLCPRHKPSSTMTVKWILHNVALLKQRATGFCLNIIAWTKPLGRAFTPQDFVFNPLSRDRKWMLVVSVS